MFGLGHGRHTPDSPSPVAIVAGSPSPLAIFAELPPPVAIVADFTRPNSHHEIHAGLLRNFQGSPHIDELDATYQYALSLGDFEDNLGRARVWVRLPKQGWEATP